MSGNVMAGPIVETSPSAVQTFLSQLERLPGGRKVRDCIQCGMCTGCCPHGYAMEYGPRRMIAAIRAGRFEDLFKTDSLWLCVSCYNCTYRCPSGVPITDSLIHSLREQLLVRGVGVPKELQAAFERSARYGNPFGESPKKRDAWIKETGSNVRILKKGESADVLWFVECFPSYHRRNIKDTAALAKVLNALGVDFGVMGADEWCAGDIPCTNVGEGGLFEMLCEHNTEQLADREFNEILVGDPHAYNALKKEYARLGSSYSVSHYTQFLEGREPDLTKLMKKQLKLKVTYHDSCCLGRRNDVYEPPRAVLEAIPGVRLVEMPRNKENALCCGGGGGAVWLDSFIWLRTRVPLPMQRVQEAAKTGADVLAVSCPLEVSRFEDAVKTSGLEGRLEVRDVADLVAESMGLTGGRRT